MRRSRPIIRAVPFLALATLLAGCGPSADMEAADAASRDAAEAPAAQEAGVDLEFLNPPDARPNAPFSEAVRVGDLLYLSGKIGSVEGGLAQGGIQAETRAVLENIQAALARHGSSMDRVFKCLVILADMGDFGAMNEVYVSYFPGPKPARSAFAASGLAAGALVEIECIAAVG